MLSQALKRAARLSANWRPLGEYPVDVYAMRGSVVMDTAGLYSCRARGWIKASESKFYEVDGVLLEDILFIDEEGSQETRNHGLIKEITLLFKDTEGERREIIIK